MDRALLPLLDSGGIVSSSSEPTLILQLAFIKHGFYACFEEILQHEEIKNIVIDLTCNGGLASLTLPYIAAHWTDDPTFTI